LDLSSLATGSVDARRLKRLGCLAAALVGVALLGSQPARAGTAAGTVLSASTAATYQDLVGTSYATTSNTVSTTVANAPILTVSAPAGQSVTAGMTVVDTFTLTNVGNAAGNFNVPSDATFAGTAVNTTLLGYVLGGATVTCITASPCALTTAITGLQAKLAALTATAINGTITIGVEYKVSGGAGDAAYNQTIQTSLGATLTYPIAGGTAAATSAAVTSTPTDTVVSDARIDIQFTATNQGSNIIWTATANNGGNFAARDSAAVGDTGNMRYEPGVPGIFFETQVPIFSTQLVLQSPPTCTLNGAVSGATATVYYSIGGGNLWTSTPISPLSNTNWVGCLIQGGAGGVELPSAPSGSLGAGSVTTPQVTFTFVTAQPSGAGSTALNAVTTYTEAWMAGQPWATGVSPLLGGQVALGTADSSTLGASVYWNPVAGSGNLPPGGDSNMAGSQAPFVARLDIQETATTPTAVGSTIKWTTTANNGGTYAASDSLAVKNLLGIGSGAVGLVTQVPVYSATALVLQSTPTCTLNGAVAGAAATLYYSTNGTTWSTTYSSTSKWLACAIAGGTSGAELPSNSSGSSGIGAVTTPQVTFTFVTAQPSAGGAVTDVANGFMAGAFGGTGTLTTIGPTIAQGTADATSVSLTTAEANTTSSIGTMYPGGASNTATSQKFVAPVAPRMDVQVTASQPSTAVANITWTATANNGGDAAAYSTTAAMTVFTLASSFTGVALIMKVPAFGGTALVLQSTPTCTDSLSLTCTVYYGTTATFPANCTLSACNTNCGTNWCVTYSASATWVAAVVKQTVTTRVGSFVSAAANSAGAGIVTTAQVTLPIVTAQPSGANASNSGSVTAFAGILVANAANGNYLVGPGILASSNTADTVVAATANTDLAFINSAAPVAIGSVAAPGGVSNSAGSQAYTAATSGTGVGTAVFVGTDSKTQGAWHGASTPWTRVYGNDGYEILDGTAGNATNLIQNPAYATVTLGGAFGSGAFAASGTTDPRAPYSTAASATQNAAQDYCGPSCNPTSGGSASVVPFTIDVNITDGGTHQFSLYLIQWDANSVGDAILVTDVTHGTNLLFHYFGTYNNNNNAFNNTNNPMYVRWNISGHVRFTLYNPQGNQDWATFSAYFFDPVTRSPLTSSNSGSYVATDTLTQGNWTPGSGGDGYETIASNVPPGYAANCCGFFGIAGGATWASSTSDIRAMYTAPGASSSTRVASAWYSGSMGFTLPMTDGNTHTVGLYFLDWDSTVRTQTIYVADNATGAIFDTRSLAGFHNGTTVVWNVKGTILFYMIQTASGQNAVLNGIFLGNRVPSLTFVDAVTPTGNQAPGTVLTYTGTVTNIGAVSALNNYVSTAIPANTDFQIGSTIATLTGTGLTSVASYSNNGGGSYAYTPVSAGGGAASGYDRNVTNVKWTFTGALTQGAGANTGTVAMAVMIR
jgi:uncharacterized repeat protein (TIGR01451 family)